MYDYQTERVNLFTDDGQRTFLKVRDHVRRLLNSSGAVTGERAISCGAGGDSWILIACVDRLVELGEIREIPQSGVAGQDRVFVEACRGI